MIEKHKQIVCLNGHQLTATADLTSTTSGFCEKCGAKLIDACPRCGKSIKGTTIDTDLIDFSLNSRAHVPQYCDGCGNPFPWTVSKIEALKELVEYSQLGTQEQSELTSAIPNLVSNTPKTKISALKWKQIGKPILSAAKDILVSIASESVIKLIYGN